MARGLRLSSWQVAGLVALVLVLAVVGFVSHLFSEMGRESAWDQARGASIGYEMAARQILGFRRPLMDGPVSCFNGRIQDSATDQLTLPACVSDGVVQTDKCDPVMGDTVAPRADNSFPDRVLTTLVVPAATLAKVADFLQHYSLNDLPATMSGYERYILSPKWITTRECKDYGVLFIEQHHGDLLKNLPRY